jgi:titin
MSSQPGSECRARLSVEALEDRLAPAAFTVTNTNDAGPGSLRDALAHANARPGTDAIAFAIGSGQQTIRVQSALPAITDRVIIAGHTQPGFAGSPLIDVNGREAGTGTHGFVIAPGGSGSVVRGLVINQFNGDAIRIRASNCRVVGNFIGTEPPGTAELSNGGNGVLIFGPSTGNIVGGVTAAARNVISGNDGNGVMIFGNAARGNAVLGNLIGTDVTGTGFIGNGVAGTPSAFDGAGVRIAGGASGNVIGGTVPAARNLISANTEVGIAIDGASGNLVIGNFIGTEASGVAHLGNFSAGVQIINGATGNVVGGVTAGARNVISGNGGPGVVIADAGTSGNHLVGNFIGTDRTGGDDLGNILSGVLITGGATGNVVGGAVAGARNVISGNESNGVQISGAETRRNFVRGNRIGLSAANGGALGNGGAGVWITGDASANFVGGLAVGTGNVVAHNADNGVRIDSGTGNALLLNRFFDNGGLGIDLRHDGITANDPGDPDTGANELLNFPELSLARLNGPALRVNGSINTEQNKTLRIEFFVSDAADPSGHGEAERFFGAITLRTGDENTVNFTAVFAAPGVHAGQFVTATATDELGNTSEFSLARMVI